jgi:hypothetical protein
MAELTEGQVAILAAWEASKIEVDRLKNLLDAAKEVEMGWRRQVAHSGITTENEGVNKTEIGNGYVLKSTIKINYKVENDYTKLTKTLARLPDGIAARVILFKPQLCLTEYRNLNERHKAIVDSVITTDEGAPVVEIVPPKSSR